MCACVQVCVCVCVCVCVFACMHACMQSLCVCVCVCMQLTCCRSVAISAAVPSRVFSRKMAAGPSPSRLFWVFARSVDRYHVGGVELSPSVIYTKHVCGEVLRSCGMPEGLDLTVDCDVKEWTKHFAGRLGMGGKVVGLVLC